MVIHLMEVDTVFIAPGPGSVAKNGVCNMCHNDQMTYSRASVVGDTTSPEMTSVNGQVGSNILSVVFSEPVFSEPGAIGNLVPSDFTLTDNDNSRTITTVTHTAGNVTATLTLSVALG